VDPSGFGVGAAVATRIAQAHGDDQEPPGRGPVSIDSSRKPRMDEACERLGLATPTSARVHGRGLQPGPRLGHEEDRPEARGLEGCAKAAPPVARIRADGARAGTEPGATTAARRRLTPEATLRRI